MAISPPALAPEIGRGEMLLYRLPCATAADSMTGGRPRAILAGMVSQDPLRDASYWWSRAEEARTIAEMMRTVHPKNIMLSIAEGYERLAKMAEQRQRT